jgi:hypothetical protein
VARIPATEADTPVADVADEAAVVDVVGAWVGEVAGVEAAVGVVDAGLLELLPPQAPSSAAIVTADAIAASRVLLTDGVATRDMCGRSARFAQSVLTAACDAVA